MSVFRYSPHRLLNLNSATLLMSTTPPPVTDVYLLRRSPMLSVFWGLPYAGLLHRGSPPIARLELTEQTLRCTLVDKSGHAGWLARRLQVPDLKKRLKSGRPVTAFEFPRDGYEISWPDTSLGNLCEIRQGQADPWIISFTLPADYEDFDFVRYFHVFRAFQTRGVRQQWRQALDPATQHVNRPAE